jgi:hypothetical protein
MYYLRKEKSNFECRNSEHKLSKFYYLYTLNVSFNCKEYCNFGHANVIEFKQWRDDIERLDSLQPNYHNRQISCLQSKVFVFIIFAIEKEVQRSLLLL